MKRTSFIALGSLIAAVSAAPAFADCSEEIALYRSSDMSATASTTPSTGTTTNFETGENVAKGGSISKDGTTAPLQGESGTQTGATPGASTGEPGQAATKPNSSSSASASAGASGGTTTTPGQTAEGGSVSKDGSTMPLASSAGGGDATMAMSDQDAASQQSGQAPAADQASISGALAKAQAALDSGDEAACLKALETVRAGKSG